MFAIGNKANPPSSKRPQANDITITASVRVNGESLNDDSYDVVRKGLSTTAGGDYKMEIKGTSDPTGPASLPLQGDRGQGE